jgi:hypothetical protein
MICGLPRTYKLSKLALHITIQLNTLIHVLPSSFLWVDTSFVLIELESHYGEKGKQDWILRLLQVDQTMVVV